MIGYWLMHRLVMALFVVSLQAQRFEVASIKPNNSAERNAAWTTGSGGRFTGTNLPLKFLILTAWQLKDSQLSGLPGWTEVEKYDISAKGESDPAGKKMLPMMQSLVADRFQLRFHWVNKQQTVYALVPAKGGIKLKASKEGTCVVRGPDEPPVAPGEKGPAFCGNYSVRGSLMDATRIQIGQLLAALGTQLDYPLIDKTGLKGAYDVHLTWNPDESVNDGADNSAGPSIFTALQEQLGLRLESTKGPVRVMVIDHVERPSEN
jgi:uncharacterized protein (TIGR03435 family)